MNYKDRQGNVYEIDTSQDKLLRLVYGSVTGRAVLRAMSGPWLSNMVGRLLSTYPSTILIDSFIKKNNINMKEFVPCRYKSYNDFFTRKLRPGKRPAAPDPESLISPADGRVSAYPISMKSVFKIKHSNYTVGSLLHDEQLALSFNGGYCIVIRLCVDDYHRYCYVDDAVKGVNHHIDGFLNTVNPMALEHIKIYQENSREYTILNTAHFGQIIQMEVGALMVGRIHNHHQRRSVVKGQEKGYFEFGGSSIVLLVKRDNVIVAEDIIENTMQGFETYVKMGEEIGRSAFTI